MIERKALEELSDAYDAVFDKDGNVKVCGRAVCLRLMYLLKRHSTANLGNFDTGVMDVDTVKAEYHRLVSQ